jgi:hypothetical protein
MKNLLLNMRRRKNSKYCCKRKYLDDKVLNYMTLFRGKDLNRSILLKAMLVGVLLVSVACSLSLFVQNISLTSSYERKIQEQATEIKNLKEDMTGLDSKLSRQQELLDSRQGFLDAVSDAKSALTKAQKSSDVTESLQLIKEAQEVVFQERGTPANIDLETEKVKKETGRLLARIGFLTKDSSLSPAQVITAADLSQQVEGLETLPKTHPARRALDAVGGTDIMLGTAPVVCGLKNSLACAYPTGVILLVKDFADKDYDFYYPVMMHEYAHQIQYKYRESMEDSEGYEELFNKDIEWLADCMAAAKIPGYSSNYHYKCSPAQVEYGAAAWKGFFQ